MSLSFSQAYATEASAPFWGAPNSRMNFCEEDYILTSYLAECVNTLTNISYVLYGAHGLSRLRGKPDGPLSFLGFPYWGLISVGVLSGYFHATLKYHSQMCDDISMLVATGFVFNRVITFDASYSSRRNRSLVVLATLTAVSVYHCIADEELVHFLAFGTMIVYIGIKTRELVKNRITDPQAKKRVGTLMNFGASCAGLGYFLWNIDVHLCSKLLSLRRRVGLPFGIFLELHGWWHILTAIGAYTFMALVEYLTTEREPDESLFLWPVKELIGDFNEEEKKK